jgi:hypothetical protein
MASFNYKQYFADHYMVVNKNAERVPFVLNPIQSKYLEGRKKRNLILKARQQGFSTFIIADTITKFLLKSDYFCMIIANDSENATGLLSRAKMFLKCYEESYNTKVPLKYNSKYELVNNSNHSTILIGSAEDIDVGRSKTIHKLHISEAAFCRNLEGLLTGALQAVPESGEVDLETTANGFNYFKNLWDQSVLDETTFNPMFFRASDFYSEEFLREKQKELGRKYPQEYPETPEEAFLTSGETYFDKRVLQYYLENTKELKDV